MAAIFEITEPYINSFYKPLCINAIVDGKFAKQLVVSPIENQVIFEACFVLGLLGSYDGSICYGEAYEKGKYETLTSKEVTKLVSLLEKNKEDYKTETFTFKKY
jgi:hypothetical protein